MQTAVHRALSAKGYSLLFHDLLASLIDLGSASEVVLVLELAVNLVLPLRVLFGSRLDLRLGALGQEGLVSVSGHACSGIAEVIGLRGR